MAQRSVSIRLGTTGKAEVTRAFDDIAASGDASARRLVASYNRAGEDIEAAMRRRASAEQKIAVLAPGLNPGKLDRFAGINDNVGKSAQSSASVFEAAYARMEARASALVAAIDPVYAAQRRFDAEMREAKVLLDAGALSTERYLQVEREAAAAINRATMARNGATVSVGQLRAGSQQLSYQIGDVAQQFALGTPAMVIFAQQGGQVVQALDMMRSTSGGLIGFLAGPWGAGLMGAGMMLAMLTNKTSAAEDADKAAAKAKEDLRKAIEDLITTQDRAIVSGERAKALAYAQIELSRREAIEIRARTAAKLADARSDAEAAAYQAKLNPEGGAVGEGLATQRLAEIQAEIARNDAEVVRLTSASTRAAATYYREHLERRSTPEGRIAAEFEGKRNAAQREAERTQDWAQYRRTINNLKAAEAAEEARNKALQASTQAVKRDTETLTTGQVAKMLRDAVPGGVQIGSGTRNRAENARAGGAANSYHLRGQAIDFVPKGGMGSMTKADVRRIFEARGVNVVELLGPGDRGHSDHFHVAWTKGKHSLDEFNDAARRAAELQRELESALGGLQGEFDPAAVAAGKYREQLAAIAKLSGLAAGDPNRLDPQKAGDYRRQALGKLLIAANPAYTAPISDGGWAEREKRRSDFAAGTLADQSAAIELARTELALVAANDNLRDSTIAKLQLILDLKRAQIPVDSAEGQRYIANGLLIDDLARKLREKQDAWRALQRVGEGAIDRLFDPNSADSWGERVKGMLGELKAELIRLALLNPLKNMLGLGGGALPTLSSLGSLFGKGLNTKTAAAPMVVLPRNAAGTEHFSGGATWIAENGPEIVNLPRGSRVTSAAETRRLLGGSGGGNAFHFDLRGAVVTEDLIGQMNSIGAVAADAGAARGAAGGSELAANDRVSAANRRLGRFTA